MAKTKVLFISRAYGQEAGGMERLSFELINQLKNHPSIEATVIAREITPGDSLFQSRMKSVLFLVTATMKALQQAKRVDVIHLGDPVLSKTGWLIKKLYKKPVAVTVHGLDVSFSNPLYQTYLKIFFKNFDQYLPISNHAKKLLEKHDVHGQITVIPPGVHDNVFKPDTKRRDLLKLLNQNDLTRENIFLLTIGRLVKRKGHMWFIENVLPKLPEEFRYIIAGSGPEELKINHPRIIMLGPVSEDQKKILLNSVDAFIQPNIAVNDDAEGFGLAPLEATTCNRLVFASNIDGIPSAIHNKQNGILLEPENADLWIDQLQLITPNTTAVKLIPDARRYTLDKFSWEAISQSYISQLENAH